MDQMKFFRIVTSGVLSSTLILSLGLPAAKANGQGEESLPVVQLPENEIAKTAENFNLPDIESFDLEETTDTNAETTQSEESSESTQAEGTDESNNEQSSLEDGNGDTEEAAEQENNDTDLDANPSNEEVEAPSLIPGDFFYFVKKMIEAIRLAVTVDDFKEAKLLADIAAERIAEAKVLIAAGKSAEAEELLKEAVKILEKANENLLNSDEVAEEAETETQAGTDEVASETDAEPVEKIDTEKPGETNNQVVIVKTKLAKNIDALIIVLEKVENPKAQQAIMKNIQKSFKKLDKKIDKLAKKDARHAKKSKKAEAKQENSQIENATNDQAAAIEIELTESQKTDKLQVKQAKKQHKKEASNIPTGGKVINKKAPAAAKHMVEKQTKPINKGQAKKLEKKEKLKGKKHEKMTKAPKGQQQNR